MVGALVSECDGIRNTTSKINGRYDMIIIDGIDDYYRF